MDCEITENMNANRVEWKTKQSQPPIDGIRIQVE